MTTWHEVSRDCYEAAGVLFRNRRWRSSASRAYYAVFSLVTGVLQGRVAFLPGYETPQHRELPNLIEKHLADLAVGRRRELKQIVRRLYTLRLMADYRRLQTTDDQSARRALSEVMAAYRILGVTK